MSEPRPVDDLPPSLRARFQVRGTLGAGGMGEVLAAVDLALERPVALKLCRMGRNPELERRFLNEARALARLRHPGVVALFDHGVEGERAWLAMERLEGASFQDQAPPDPLGAMLQIAEALDAVHGAGLVHRDVKPSNLVMAGDRAVLLDFGLVLTATGTRITATDVRVGTPAFMAPELLRGDASTSASDWYGWGASLYYLLEGRPPRAWDDLLAHAAGAALQPLAFTRVPEEEPVVRLLRACLELDPHRRPRQAREVRALLRPGGAAVEPRRGPRRIRALLAVAGLALLLGAGSTWRRRPAPPAASSPAPPPAASVPDALLRVRRVTAQLAEICRRDIIDARVAEQYPTRHVEGVAEAFLANDLPGTMAPALAAFQEAAGSPEAAVQEELLGAPYEWPVHVLADARTMTARASRSANLLAAGAAGGDGVQRLLERRALWEDLRGRVERWLSSLPPAPAPPALATLATHLAVLTEHPRAAEFEAELHRNLMLRRLGTPARWVMAMAELRMIEEHPEANPLEVRWRRLAELWDAHRPGPGEVELSEGDRRHLEVVLGREALAAGLQFGEAPPEGAARWRERILRLADEAMPERITPACPPSVLQAFRVLLGDKLRQRERLGERAPAWLAPAADRVRALPQPPQG